jgi:acyl carrier protein
MIEEKVRAVMAGLFGDEVRDMQNPRRDGVAAWDSLKHVELIFAVEDAFDVSFDESEMESLDSEDAIVAAVRAKL